MGLVQMENFWVKRFFFVLFEFCYNFFRRFIVTQHMHTRITLVDTLVSDVLQVHMADAAYNKGYNVNVRSKHLPREDLVIGFRFSSSFFSCTVFVCVCVCRSLSVFLPGDPVIFYVAPDRRLITRDLRVLMVPDHRHILQYHLYYNYYFCPLTCCPYNWHYCVYWWCLVEPPK